MTRYTTRYIMPLRVLFNSFQFLLLFLPVTLFVARRLKGVALLRWITLASLVFYGFAGHAWFLIPMLFTTVLDYLLAQKIEVAGSKARRRGLLLVSLCGNLGLLAYFKYAGLVLRTVHAPPGWLGALDVVLPAGISFYTFQTLSYIIDVYRGECHAERSFFRFAGFVSFFPHLIAGPLTRHNQLIPALKTIADRGIVSRWEEGLYLFSIGLSKKVLVADRIANFIDPMLANIPSLGAVRGWLALLGYAMQIYFDFS